ncbi:TetR/AcrR family transcriptional regulator [Actinokineospora enzanensis]|uniref:TetR/AcrR family transcriptional regulator n=1 Tax=Actinokineospora enzanensis TaxID=155975 RepID=UPI00037FC18E|nr:TetR/AcrR family transcriptional regulator [Actinokineospora enzanensis]
MSPRKSAVETRRTRQRILDRGVAIASVDGLEGLTIGRLAAEMEMSKAGILGHFGTKETLQLAVIDTAAELFTREVPARVRATGRGLPYLRAACEAWVSYLERGVFPGGCFFTSVAAEFDGRGGPIRDAVAALQTQWQRNLTLHIRHAVVSGDLSADTDVEQLIYELTGVILSLNHFLQLNHDATAPARARRALQRLLPAPSAELSTARSIRPQFSNGGY